MFLFVLPFHVFSGATFLRERFLTNRTRKWMVSAAFVPYMPIKIILVGIILATTATMILLRYTCKRNYQKIETHFFWVERTKIVKYLKHKFSKYDTPSSINFVFQKNNFYLIMFVNKFPHFDSNSINKTIFEKLYVFYFLHLIGK